MNNIIYRIVDKNAHVLNTTTEELLTFYLSQKELNYLNKTLAKNSYHRQWEFFIS